MALELTSPAFKNGEFIPRKYTGEGEDVSPALNWKDVPAGTKSLALINDDPDAPVGTWVHWVIYNIPADKKGIPEAVPTDATLPDGSKQGITDFGKPGYGGPMPPPGKPHRYFFKLYCLDTALNLKAGATKTQVLGAMKGRILDQAELVGKYQR